MLWNREMKQLGRTPLRVLAFCLILAIAIGLVGITAGLADAAEYATHAIEGMFITYGRVARVPDYSYGSTSLEEMTQASQAEVDQRNLGGFLINDLSRGEISLESGTVAVAHSWLMAYDPAYMPLTTYGNDVEDESYLMNMPQNLGLFAVTCTKVTPTVYGKHRLNTYSLDVNEIGFLHPDLPVPEHLTLELIDGFSGSVSAIQPGHHYWIWGYYEPTEGTAGTLTPHYNAATNKYYTYDTRNVKLNMTRLKKDGIVYITQPLNARGKPLYSLPFIGEYTGSASEYLQTDAVGMWSKLREVLESSARSLRVCSSDDVECLYPFTEGNTRLIEGEFFSEEQVESGEKVVIISDLFAAQNGLALGDTLDLSFWRTDWEVYQRYVENELTAMPQPISLVGMHVNDHEEMTTEVPAKPASRNDGIYTIVGIYQSTGYRDDFRYMHPNTVIVPQSALYEHIRIAGESHLNMTFIIPNGGAAALEAELATLGTWRIESGFAGLLAYDDSGYSAIVPNVRAIRDGTQFVYGISLGLSCIVSLIALILFISAFVPAGQIKYRLGVGKWRIWLQMTLATTPLLILSGVMGSIGSNLLYGRATEWMVGADFTSFDTSFSTVSDTAQMLEQIFSLLVQDEQFFMRAAAIQVGILALLSVLLCALFTWRRIGFRK